MSLDLLLSNLASPPILFFLLGVVAALVHSDLEVPQPIPKILASYLLLSIGFRGGYELSHSELNGAIALALAAAVFMAIVVPIYAFWILRWRFGLYDAAAIAATYGSISAVTFITAVSFLNAIGVGFGGHMVAAMAVMESPAIVVGVLLARWTRHGDAPQRVGMGEVLREAFLNGSVLLLLGSLLIGLASGERGWETMAPFVDELFLGILAFFLLDMGLLAARRIGDLRKAGVFLVGFAVLLPLLNAAIGIGIAALLDLGPGDALLFTVLSASASYIAVPAAMRLSVPEANPSLYIGASLAVTFPFNILIGIPLYYELIEQIWS